MCELRSNHFHSGIDIKTYGRTGLALHSIADGYISRIKVSPYGYGKAIYITHPTLGYTSVYAHCKYFEKKINTYVRKKQYAKESFAIELHPKPNEFPVKKGDIIAYSGNTGGSFGPHLHFEIRTLAQIVLNPLFFNFSEVKDNIPPTFQKMLIKPLDINSRVNNQLSSEVYTVKSLGKGKYVINETIQAWGNIGIMAKMFDMLNGASNHNGISSYTLEFDEKQYFKSFIETYSFSHRRDINVHTDYDQHLHKKQWFQKCYKHDGNRLNFYTTNYNQGIITIKDNKTHRVKITALDAYGNSSTLTFNIKGNLKTTYRNPTITGKPTIKHSYLDNTLKIDISNSPQLLEDGIIYGYRKKSKIKLSYVKGNTMTYLMDLRHFLPDSVVIGDYKIQTDLLTTVYPKRNFDFYNSIANVHFPRHCLFDTVYFEMTRQNETLHIGRDEDPLASSITITYKPKTTVFNKSKTRMYRVGNRGRLSYEGGYWIKNNIQFKISRFGQFVLKTDTERPKVQRLKDIKNSVRFKISDNLSGINTYRATINGKFLLLNYNYKVGVLSSEREDESQPLKGVLKLEVTDQVGNRSVYTTTL